MGVGGLGGLLSPQRLQLLGQGAGRAQRLLGLLVLLLRPAAGVRELLLDLAQTGGALGDLPG